MLLAASTVLAATPSATANQVSANAIIASTPNAASHSTRPAVGPEADGDAPRRRPRRSG